MYTCYSIEGMALGGNFRIGVYPMTPPAFNSADTCKVHVSESKVHVSESKVHVKYM